MAKRKKNKPKIDRFNVNRAYSDPDKRWLNSLFKSLLDDLKAHSDINRWSNSPLNVAIIGAVIGSVISSIIAFISLCYIEDTNRKINLKPYLEVGVGKAANGVDYGLLLRNAGKGPAIIKSGYISIGNTEYHLNQIKGNIWDSGFEKAKILETSLNEADIEGFRDQGITTKNSCRMFAKLDYIPSVGDAIKDGEELTLLAFPMQTKESHIIKAFEVPDVGQSSELNEEQKILVKGLLDESKKRFKKAFRQCQDSFKESIANGIFKIKIEYKSLNEDTNVLDKQIEFDVR